MQASSAGVTVDPVTSAARTTMTLFGDIERAFASLYPHRIPLALLAAAGAGLLLVVALRRGWHRIPARHPRAAVALTAVVLVVGAPVGWYLGSPLVVTTRLVEDAPAAALPSPGGAAVEETPPLAPPTSAAGDGPDASTAGPVPGGVRSGTFVGADEFHFGRGEALLVPTAGGGTTLRLQDFAVRNGPDLYVYLSPDPAGFTDGALELGLLKASEGSFNYEIPAGADLAQYASVVIWCRAFGVLFATATLTG